MLQRLFKAAPAAQIQISVWTYRFALVITLAVLFVVFSAADGGYCTGISLASINKNEASNCFEFWLNRYQGLIGGILALAGAALAFAAVRSQISQTERLNGLAQSRKEDAASAVAPFALSTMVDYATQCMDVISAARDEVLAHNTHPVLHVDPLPDSIISMLRDYVEYGDSDHAGRAAMLLYATQIQQSRLHSLQRKVTTHAVGLFGDSELQQAMFDALDLHAQVSGLFTPIRKNYRSRTFPIQHMYNDLRVRGIELSEWPLLKFSIEAFQRAQEGEEEPPPPLV